jgi:hypothetical protein
MQTVLSHDPGLTSRPEFRLANPMPHGVARSSGTPTESESTSTNAGAPARYEAGRMRLGRRLPADVLNARRLDDPPNVTSRSVPGAVGPRTLSDRDQRARRIAVQVSNTHPFDELGHAEASAEWVPKGPGRGVYPLYATAPVSPCCSRDLAAMKSLCRSLTKRARVKPR